MPDFTIKNPVQVIRMDSGQTGRLFFYDSNNALLFGGDFESVEFTVPRGVAIVKDDFKSDKGTFIGCSSFKNCSVGSQTLIAKSNDGKLRFQVTIITNMTSQLKRIYGLVPKAQRWADATIKVLAEARNFMATNGFDDKDLRSLRLVNRCFKVIEDIGVTLSDQQKSAQVIGDLDRAAKIFNEIKAVLAAVRNNKIYIHEVFDDPDEPATIAYALIGYWKYKNPINGIYFVKSAIEKKTDDFIVDAMMHELAHFVGPESPDPEAVGHAIIEKETAYGRLALKVDRVNAFRNASSYAWLAYLARMSPEQWMKAV
jgi:hypothetical protein